VFEIPELLSTVLEKHSAALRRDLIIAVMVSAGDRLRELEEVASP
jgi:hypothetical protein